MSSPPVKPCPDLTALRELLDAANPDLHVERHVDNCDACQTVLATLIEDGPAQAWRDLLGAGYLANTPAADTGSPIETQQWTRNRVALPDLPGYDIHAEVGRGGGGVVYDATCEALERRVALKMLVAGELSGPEQLARFRNEARAVARLRHPNIVAIHDYGEHNGLPFLSMELIEGPSLAHFISGTPQPFELAATILRELAIAVDTAHRQGIVHRDIKPANVLIELEEDGEFRQAKLTDFGIARDQHQASYTQTHQLLGTPGYMAPERFSGDARDVKPSVDIYALGCVLFELLTGRPPFHGVTRTRLLSDVHGMDAPRLRTLVRSIPRDLETICEKCMAPEPDQRYTTALALADDLQRFQEHRPLSVRPVGWSGRVVRWARRNRLLAAATATVAVATVGWLVTSTFLWVRSEHYRGNAEALVKDRDKEIVRSKGNLQSALQAIDLLLDLDGSDDLFTRYSYENSRDLAFHRRALELYTTLNESNDANSEVRFRFAMLNLWVAKGDDYDGDKELARKRRVTAYNVLAELATNNPDVARYWFGYGEATTTKGPSPGTDRSVSDLQAAVWYGKAAELAPENEMYHAGRAMAINSAAAVLMRSGNAERVQELFDVVNTELLPRFHENPTSVHLGDMYLRTNVTQARAERYLGEYEACLDRIDAYIAVAKELISHHPDLFPPQYFYAYGLFDRGRVLNLMHQHEDAVVSLEASVIEWEKFLADFDNPIHKRHLEETREELAVSRSALESDEETACP